MATKNLAILLLDPELEHSLKKSQNLDVATRNSNFHGHNWQTCLNLNTKPTSRILMHRTMNLLIFHLNLKTSQKEAASGCEKFWKFISGYETQKKV